MIPSLFIFSGVCNLALVLCMGRKTTSYSLADKLKKENVMQRKLTTLALTITALTFGSAVSAKTLVY
ncbi:TPA: hypothetical protein ACX3KG_001868, partial [Raoultella ornithinolytica]